MWCCLFFFFFSWNEIFCRWHSLPRITQLFIIYLWSYLVWDVLRWSVVVTLATAVLFLTLVSSKHSSFFFVFLFEKERKGQYMQNSLLQIEVSMVALKMLQSKRNDDMFSCFITLINILGTYEIVIMWCKFFHNHTNDCWLNSFIRTCALYATNTVCPVCQYFSYTYFVVCHICH